jgi:hypothetical protein
MGILGATIVLWRTAEFRRSGVEIEFLSFGVLELARRVNEELEGSVLSALCEDGVNVNRSNTGGVFKSLE